MDFYIKLSALPLVVALATFSEKSEAAAWATCDDKTQIWKNYQATMHLSTTSFPQHSSWRNSVERMMSEWNAIAGSGFTFLSAFDTDGTHSSGNGVNEVYFADLEADSFLGVTALITRCYWEFGDKWGIKEADIAINTRWEWTTNKFDGSNLRSPYNFELIVLHELGHALGLDHDDGRLATMNADYFNGGPFGYYHDVKAHGDDRYGVRYLYPESSTERDVAASAYTIISPSSTTSTHRGRKNIVRALSTAGTVNLTRGSQYDIEYTIENLGTQAESGVDVHFYLSTNNFIASSDTYLGSTSWSMPAGSIAEARKRITVPTGLAPGTYYVGYYVDATVEITESDEWDNFVALIDPVTIN